MMFDMSNIQESEVMALLDLSPVMFEVNYEVSTIIVIPLEECEPS